jgi:putative DNA primase/helicase
MCVIHGSGANGKTIFAETLQAVLGDYTQEAEPDLLLARKDAHPTGIARLHGKRMVWASENDDNRRFAEGTIKPLTGGDKVTARYLYQDFFEFTPTHKLWLLTNHRPSVQGTDDGIWRRLRLIPFVVTIQPERQDKNLVAKLSAESSGILNWLLDACLRWQASGLTEPLAVTMATAGYRADMDTLAEFIGDCCEVGDSCMTDSASLYATYTFWCSLTGEEPVTQALLGRRLRDRGFTKTKHGVKRRAHWQGLAVRISAPMLGKRNPS